MQARLKLEQQQKAIDELSELLNIAETDRDKYIKECSEARVQLNELEHKLNEMTDQSLETRKVREQLQVAMSELKIRQEELLGIETELAASRESELKGIVKIELLENNAHLEKEKTVDLIRHISELNEAIRRSNFAVDEAKKEMSAALSSKDADLELAREKVVEVQNQLEEMSKQTELVRDLESQLQAKALYTDMIESALKQTNEQIKADLEVMDRESSDQALYIESLKLERNQLKEEVKNANEEIEKFKDRVETLKHQLEKMKLEMDEMKERGIGAEVEIALLKSELHEGRSKIAAAEAAEARAESVKSGLYLAVQDLAAEAAEVKKENIKLKQGPFWAYEENENPILDKTSPGIEEDLNAEASDRRDETATITITLEEYQSLITNVDPTPELSADNSSHLASPQYTDELEKLKKELEAAMIRIGEFRSRAEQATTRAEMAEKAKEAVEDQLRKWREHKQRRKAAVAAMKEVSAPKFKPPMYEGSSTVYQPLGKVLNLKL